MLYEAYSCINTFSTIIPKSSLQQLQEIIWVFWSTDFIGEESYSRPAVVNVTFGWPVLGQNLVMLCWAQCFFPVSTSMGTGWDPHGLYVAPQWAQYGYPGRINSCPVWNILIEGVCEYLLETYSIARGKLQKAALGNISFGYGGCLWRQTPQ